MQLKSYKKENSLISKLRFAFICFSCLGIGIFLGWKNIPGDIKANLVILQKLPLWTVIKEKNQLDTINLDIPFKGITKIITKRKNALKQGLLFSSDADFVNANISWSNENHNCKIRLKGDLPDHWSGEKFSLRIEMKNGSLVKGMSRFSLQDPVTRNNTAEWLFQESLKSEGLMGVRYEFVNLIINGKPMGIYAMEEHFSKELIESNNRREGVIVHFNDYLLWKKFPANLSSNIEWNSIYRSAPAEVRNNKRVRSNPTLNKQKVTALNLLRSLQNSKLPPSKIFDSENLGKFLAISRLWGAEKSLFYGDINFYFNPVTCLLEPIGFDGNPSQAIESPYCYFSWGYIKDNWVNYSLTDTKIAYSYISHLFKFIQKDYLRDINSNLRSHESKFRNLLSRELLWESREKIWKNIDLLDYQPWTVLERRAEVIRDELLERNLIQGYANRIKKRSELKIILRNTTTQPVEIYGFTSGKKFWSAIDIFAQRNSPDFKNQSNKSVILFGQGNGIRQTEKDKEFFLPAKEVLEPIFAHIRLLGSPNDYFKHVVPIDEFAFDPDLLPTNKNSRFDLDSFPFMLEENESLWIPPGLHIIKKDLYIPANKKLTLSPGTKMLFDQNCTFVSEASIHFLGTKEKPIILSSKEDSWAGLLLVNAPGNSVLENVKFSNIHGVGKGPNPQGITKNGWTLTGGISVYRSNVEFRKCTFSDFKTEDALNVISSTFSLTDCNFSGHYSDAFDGDFVVGNISGSYFSNISGDGVDFSGSSAIVKNCFFRDLTDKAISVGESSKVKVSNCNIINTSFGVVSKDMSTTQVLENTIVSNARIAAFSAFQKKDSFGPASIDISNSKIINCKKLALIQEGSSGLLNGKILQTIPFHSSDLYEPK